MGKQQFRSKGKGDKRRVFPISDKARSLPKSGPAHPSRGPAFQAHMKSETQTATIPPYAVRELDLYQANDSELYRWRQQWSINYGRKMQKGKYDKKLALKGIRDNFVPGVIRKYRKDFGSDWIRVRGDKDDPDDYYLRRVSKADKEALAKKILPAIEEEAEWMLKNEPEKLKYRRG